MVRRCSKYLVLTPSYVVVAASSMTRKRAREEEEEGEAVEELTGFVQDGELLLRGADGQVYLSERDWAGNLVPLKAKAPELTDAEAKARVEELTREVPCTVPSDSPPPWAHVRALLADRGLCSAQATSDFNF